MNDIIKLIAYSLFYKLMEVKTIMEKRAKKAGKTTSTSACGKRTKSTNLEASKQVGKTTRSKSAGKTTRCKSTKACS